MGVCEEDAHMSATGLASQIDIWTFVFTRRLQKRPLAPLPLQGPTRGGGVGSRGEGRDANDVMLPPEGNSPGGPEPGRQHGARQSWAARRGCISVRSEGSVSSFCESVCG